jgi:multifunctional methyltransferase subunit TRM112
MELFQVFRVLTQLKITETPFNKEFARHVASSAYWPGIVIAANSVGIEGLPLEFSPVLLDDESVLRVLHHVLFDIHIMEGSLVCPETGHRFPISNGIPNMM